MTISETRIDVPHQGYPSIPCSIWQPEHAPRGVVLLGHGLGVDKAHETVRYPVEVLVGKFGAAVVVPEIPLHGVRAQQAYDTLDIVGRWQEFWVSGGIEALTAELQRLVEYSSQHFEGLPVSYFGLSLGTQYGIPFLAQTEGIRAAALGLFGSHPPPKTPVMNRFAPAVSCPVYFIQKLDDEIHAVESTAHLFSTLGSAEKTLDSSNGRHAEVSPASVEMAAEFLLLHSESAT